MVWRGSLEIRFVSYAVRFKLSDSMIIARRETVGYMGQAYNPLICIEHPDEQYVCNLFEKLYCGEYGFEDIQKGTCIDKYGMRWISIMEFPGEDCIYAIKYADSPESVIDKLSVGTTLNRPISPDEDGLLYSSMIDRYGFVWEVFGS